MISSILRATILVTALYAAPLAAQQPKALDLEMEAGWTHPKSGLFFPKEMVGVPFLRATEFVDGGWDTSLQYNDRGDQNIVSVYIYQAALQDVGLLFAESRHVIQIRKDYFGTVTPIYAAKAFAPPRRGTPSGLRIVYSTDGNYPATALAIMPLGRSWIVNFRLSSKTKSPQELDAALDDAINMLGWPSDETAHQAATEAKDCTGSLPKFKKAKLAKGDGASAILNAALFGMESDDKEEQVGEPPSEKISYCRDRSAPFELGIYRPDAATDRYLVSLGDSGRAVFVEPDIAALLLDDDKKGKTHYTVRLVGPGSVEIFPAHDRMLSPQQAVEIINGMAPISSTSRGGRDQTININSSTLK